MKKIEIGSAALNVSLGDLGARILSIRYKGVDVALSYASDSDAINDECYLGVTVGPICNRIANSRLALGGQIFTLPANEGENCLHSGGKGFDKKYWTLREYDDTHAEFKLEYDMSEIGMLGKLTIYARYRVEGSTLTISYRAECNHDTYINITNHVYLNLGQTGASIHDHEFSLFGDSFVDVDKQGIPTGTCLPLESPLSYQLDQPHHIGQFEGGVDHHFNVASDETKMRTMVEAKSQVSGIGLKVRSNAPGYQFYTAKYLQPPFVPSGAFCIETQYAPDAINQPGFYSPILRAGEKRARTTEFQFSQLAT